MAFLLALGGCTPAPTGNVILPGVGGSPVTINPYPPLSSATPVGPFVSNCQPMSDGNTRCVAP